MLIGPLNLNFPLALAPMEDVTDISFRIFCRQMGADLVYTEFTSCEGIIRRIPKVLKKIEIAQVERPVAIQLFGGVESSMSEAARIAESFGPDFIDINCGCWVKNVVARNEGAGLLRDLKKFEAIVKATVQATKLPVTVKTRLGWDDKSIVILDVAKMVEQAGAQALTVHCRTRAQAHEGKANWNWLEKIKKVISIPLIGNGDLSTPQDVKRMLETGCDGAMIGRGAIGNPWIFRQTKHFLKTGDMPPAPTFQERIEVMLNHLRLSVQYKGEKFGVLEFRKHYAGYLRGMPRSAVLRNELMQIHELEKIEKRFETFLDELSVAVVP